MMSFFKAILVILNLSIIASSFFYQQLHRRLLAIVCCGLQSFPIFLSIYAYSRVKQQLHRCLMAILCSCKQRLPLLFGDLTSARFSAISCTTASCPCSDTKRSAARLSVILCLNLSPSARSSLATSR